MSATEHLPSWWQRARSVCAAGLCAAGLSAMLPAVASAQPAQAPTRSVVSDADIARAAGSQPVITDQDIERAAQRHRMPTPAELGLSLIHI